MPKCQHSNIQEFTEICLDCGRNVYETDEQYEARLEKEVEELKRQVGKDRISKLEKEREDLLKEINGAGDDEYPTW